MQDIIIDHKIIFKKNTPLVVRHLKDLIDSLQNFSDVAVTSPEIKV